MLHTRDRTGLQSNVVPQAIQFSPGAMERGEGGQEENSFTQVNQLFRVDAPVHAQSESNASYVDARQVRLQFGVDPVLHHQQIQSVIDQAQVQRDHSIQRVLGHAQVQHDHEVQRIRNQAQFAHDQILTQTQVQHEQSLQNQAMSSQQALEEFARVAQSRHEAIVGDHEHVIQDLKSAFIEQQQKFDRERQTMFNQFQGQLHELGSQLNQVSLERDSFKEELDRFKSQALLGDPSAAHCAPRVEITAAPSAAHRVAAASSQPQSGSPIGRSSPEQSLLVD